MNPALLHVLVDVEDRASKRRPEPAVVHPAMTASGVSPDLLMLASLSG